MPDWDAVTQEVTGYLQDLIRIDTTNPPGNEIEAARYVAQVLRGAGLESEITESAPGRGNVTTRVAGGSRPPLLLLSHTDVVAVDAEHWTHPPFGGELHGGQVWGRGALDMKNMVAAELMVMLLLQREGVRLNRDVMFAATADEEAGRGDHGAGWLLDHHPEQIDAPFIITEGGGHDMQVGSRRFTSCQIGQKGICRMRVRASGAPGHASVPHADNAVLRLCRAVGRLDGVDLPLHTSQAMSRFIDGIADGQDAALAAGLHAIQDPDTGEQALRQLSIPAALKDQLHALLRNTASVTMLAAGSGINVIPTEATAWIDGRLAPGQTDASLLDELRAHLGDEVQIEVDQYSPAIAADTETELYRTIVQVMATHDAEAPVVPTLSTGGTDAKHIQPRRPDTQIYGFMPLRQSEGEHLGLMHGHDERTSVANLGLATRILYEVVCRFGGVQR